MEKTGVSATVEYDYTAKESDELTLKRGAIITNIKIQPGGWWEGTLTATGRTGMFPDNFVRVLEPDDTNPVVLRDKTAALNRRCKVIYSYQENKPDELTLAVGDVVEIFEEVEEGWWKGKLKGKVGVFPSNFVELIESASPMSANRRSSTGGPPKATAGGLLLDGGGGSNSIGSLSKSNSLNKSRSSLTSSRENLDDVISNQQQQLLHDAPSLPPKPVRDLCKVLFAYAPANEDELRLVEGDIITILSKELPDKGWWKGELKGRVGVFPDNFVVVLPPEVSPVKESSFHPKPERPPPSNKILIGKQNNNQPGVTNAYRKESFGSKDSLNEPAANTNNNQVTGPPAIGNVAAHRRSLETRNVENHATTNNSNASPVLAPVTEKPPRKSLDGKSSEIRKSLENLDDKKGTPPPVLGKKPQVPIKKSPSITSVTGNLFSGLKQKVKGGDSKHQDGTDGVGGSRMKSDVADNNDRNVSGERLSRDESEFGHVERGSVLKDMRANRAKAPKRRPPTSAGSIMGESLGSNGLSNGNSGLFHQLSQSGAEPESPKPDLLNVSQLSNSNDEEFIAKPKAREWEKHKVPWMDELKASQAKKTSPNVSESKSPEHRDSVTSSNNLHHQQLLEETTKQSSTTSASVSASGRTRLSERAATTSSVADVTSSTANSVNNNNSSFDLIASSRKETTNSHHQHSLTNSSVEHQHSSSTSSSTTNTNTTTSNNVMTKSMSALSTKIAISSDSGANSSANDVPTSANSSNRPVSVNLRNRSISPTPITRNTKTIHITSTTAAAATSGGPTMVLEAAPTNNGTSTTAIGGGSAGSVVTSDNVCSRVQDLEQKVNRMERQLTTQNSLIEDLKRLLREESDRVKTLQKELEKYAQCVTQV